MRKSILVIAILLISYSGFGQFFMQGSIQKGAAYNKVDVLFKANFASNAGEYVNYVQFSLAIPAAAYNGNVTATLTPVGAFAPLVFAQGAQYTQLSTNERVFTWVCVNPAVTAMSWTTAEFIGATVTFNGGPANTQVKLVDYTNAGGGSNSNTYFAINATQHGGDLTNYADFFYNNPGVSQENTYPNADQFVQTALVVSLPVNILSFSGYKSGSRNLLSWRTSSESNNKGFEVLRATDGVNYTPIGYVNTLAAGGNSATELNYSFNDNNLSGDKWYYRLRQEDIDGRSKYSNVVLIKGDKGAFMTVGGLFPNPATDMVNIIVNAPGKDRVNLIVSDMSGKMVTMKTAGVDAGSNTIGINITGLPSGTYMIRLVCGNGCDMEAGKFVKQ